MARQVFTKLNPTPEEKEASRLQLKAIMDPLREAALLDPTHPARPYFVALGNPQLVDDVLAAADDHKVTVHPANLR